MDKLVNMLIFAGALKTPTLIEAFRAVDRADFMPDEFRSEAYLDTALPIGSGQTISQPYTVAFMFELLNPQAGEKVMDVGSGSGWTTALLARIVGGKGNVFGVEIIPELVEMGRHNLSKYAFPHASISKAGKELGLPDEAPFDRILVSASAVEFPKKLVEQLKIGGTLVLPIRTAIWRVLKKTKDELDIQKHEGFAFVPLV